MDEPTADLQAIRQLAEAWRAGWLTSDAESLLSLYTEEPVLLPHGQPPIFGKAAIRPLYEAVFREVTIRSEGRLMEVRAFGDWGYFWSTYRLTATPVAGGEPIRSDGKSLFIVHRESDGVWRIARLIDNGSGE